MIFYVGSVSCMYTNVYGMCGRYTHSLTHTHTELSIGNTGTDAHTLDYLTHTRYWGHRHTHRHTQTHTHTRLLEREHHLHVQSMILRDSSDESDLGH